jgi:RNA polymerase sigma-54 factor
MIVNLRRFYKGNFYQSPLPHRTNEPMALSQGLYQRQLQKLSPQQIQLMKLLQVPTAQLEERIKEELEDNPALEAGDADEGDLFDKEVSEEFDNGEEEFDGSEEEYGNIDISEYVQAGDDEVADYKTRDDHYGESDENKTHPHKVETGFNELMLEQLGQLTLSEQERKIAEQIIGNLDDDGYLRRDPDAIVDDLAFRQNIITNREALEALILQIQDFDPAGVCARNLQECLLIQLYRRREQGVNVDLPVRVLESYFDEFSKKHYDKIKKGLDIEDAELREIISTIIKLNPKPGSNIGTAGANEGYVIPDFFIINNNGKLELTLNSKNAPDLRISEGYRDMLKDYDRSDKKDRRQKEAILFIKQKIDAAKWFIDAIQQRQHTLLSTMEAIMNYQQLFFLSGDETELRPMILKDIAELTHLDISTVSRVANSKFVQTEFGTYRLKFFFSESLQTESGEEVSTREVKKILSDLIAAEDKKHPLSDERLTELLQERGYNIARRTVAKYREQLNLPVARMRKEL